MIISIAPMLDWTDRHYRYFMRKLTRHTVLYTEMITADAIINGNRDRLLSFNQEELPLIVQLGGSDPQKLAKSALICQDYGYSGINLNVGCPSSRVSSGNFGACLMDNPKLVGECFNAIKSQVSIPVGIKHRLGLGYNYSYEYLANFVETVSSFGCTDFIVHARNAILSGLSPKQNREIPPLNYEFVYKLKQDFKDCHVGLNGGVTTFSQAKEHLNFVDEVMIGREAYYNPYLFSSADQDFFNANTPIKSRVEVAFDMIPYLELIHANNIPLANATRHMGGLFYKCKMAKVWRYNLTNQMALVNDINLYLNLLIQIQKEYTE